MLLGVDAASPVPLAQQIAGQVRGAIVREDLQPGERLAPARDLAVALGVNMHTVLRAYAELRDEGLIELRRGRGAAVRRGASAERARLVELARGLTETARRLGMSEDEAVAVLRTVWS